MVVLACAMGGCVTETPLRGDVTFTAEERAAIERGNAWVAERISREPYAIVWDLPHAETGAAEPFTITHRISGGPYAEPGHGSPGAFYAPQGRAFFAESRVELHPSDPRTLAAVAAHEFGHLHGLTHHHGVGLMSDNDGASLSWTDADRAQCVVDGVCH